MWYIINTIPLLSYPIAKKLLIDPVSPSSYGVRDHRIDALRGIALTMMIIDHIPSNFLNRFTMRNIGFADAAEIFVLLAGYASFLAYGRIMLSSGIMDGFKSILFRCTKLYLFQIILVCSTVCIIAMWRQYWLVPVDFLEPEIAWSIGTVWWRTMIFFALPSNLNILPLYVVLLLWFPVLFVIMRTNSVIMLIISGALWAWVNLNPAINFPNWLDPDGWYFNPFAWQFLFAIGVFAAKKSKEYQGDIPRYFGITVICWFYLIFSFMEVFPWVGWGLPDLRLFSIHPVSKMMLSPLRLLDVMAIFYLIQSSPRTRNWAKSAAGQVMAVCGRHSLEIFSAGTIFDLLGRLLFQTFGDGWFLQFSINVAGWGLLYPIALWLDRRKLKRKVAIIAHA